MQSPVSLAAIRNSIVKRRRAKFTYERHTDVVADLYLLGHARKSAAYIVVAWCLEPEWGWRVFRYSEIREFETVGPVDMLRGDFDPYDREIMTIDTQMLSRRHRGGTELLLSVTYVIGVLPGAMFP